MFAGMASASILGDAVDITATLDLDEFDHTVGPLVEQDLGVTVDATTELSLADDVISNPSGWGGGVDVDIDGALNQIIVTGSWDFQTSYIDIEDIDNPGLVLDSVWLDSDTLFLNDGFFVQPELDLSWTDDSISID